MVSITIPRWNGRAKAEMILKALKK